MPRVLLIIYRYNTLVVVGGEGIIVRHPFAPYTPGYSHFIYKFKVCADLLQVMTDKHLQKFKDAEALVLRKLADNTWRCKVYVVLYAIDAILFVDQINRCRLY